MSIFTNGPKPPARPGTIEAHIAHTLAHLTPAEVLWARNQQFLEGQGYLLRRRYHSHWQPSWKVFGGYYVPPGTEDAIQLPVCSSLIVFFYQQCHEIPGRIA